jgi:hypothetical protein
MRPSAGTTKKRSPYIEAQTAITKSPLDGIALVCPKLLIYLFKIKGIQVFGKWRKAFVASNALNQLEIDILN